MSADAGQAIGVIRVDGGMAASDWTMQFVADMARVPVDRPANLESTALGAAFAAGWQAGVYPGPESFPSVVAPSACSPRHRGGGLRGALSRLAGGGGRAL